MLSIGEGARRETIQQIEQLGTKNLFIKKSQLTDAQRIVAQEKMSLGLNIHDVERIRESCDFIKDICGARDVTATIQGLPEEQSPQIVACQDGYASIQNLHVTDGRFLTVQDIIRRNQVCVIGNTFATYMGLAGVMGKYIRIANSPFKIVGVLARHDFHDTQSSTIAARNFNEMIFIPLGTEKGFDTTGKRDIGPMISKLDSIILQVHKSNQVLDAAAITDRTLNVTHNGVRDFQIVIPQELLKQSQKTQKIFNIVLGAIAGVSLLVGGIGVMNIMLATVSERTREIGIRRAVGATRRHIVEQFLTEAVLLTFAGGLIGVAAGCLSVRFITAYAQWKTIITPWSVGVPLVMSILVGVFFGLYPAVQASRMDPITALRYE